jgi:two-component system, OmpR family, response regulator
VVTVRLLVVEDEPEMAAVLRSGLVEAGFAVDVVGGGAEAVWLATEQPYDVLVLDLGLPDVDGLVALSQLRARGCWTPVLVLTARDGVPDRVAGLDGGADDYVTKPFAFAELVARLRALVRRGAVPRPVLLEVGDLRLDPGRREVHRGATPLRLTPREFAVLECLMRAAGQVVSKTQLLEKVWDFAFEPESNVVEVYVANLRRKIDRPVGGSRVETVRGAGYRLRDEPLRT